MLADKEPRRKLAAILTADVAGYSRLMGEDEVATVHTLTAYREFAEHHNACTDCREARICDLGRTLLRRWAELESHRMTG